MTSVDYKVDLKINKLTKSIYDQLSSSGSLASDQIYLVEEEFADLNGQQIKNVANPTLSNDVATKGYVDQAIISAGGNGHIVTVSNSFYVKNYGDGEDYHYGPGGIKVVFDDYTVQTYNYVQLQTSLSGKQLPKKAIAIQPIYNDSQDGVRSGIALSYAPETSFELNGKRWLSGSSYPVDPEFYPLAGSVTIMYSYTNGKWNGSCVLKGTLITLADYSQKKIEDITYDDELLVWNFDEGKFDSSKPSWIKKVQKSDYYFINKLSSGKELLTTGKSATGWGHRMYDVSKDKFVYTTQSVSDSIFTMDGIETHMSCQRIDAECEYYNIITKKHFNLFANRILTSCSLNNMYDMKDMKFVKDNRKYRSFDEYSVSKEMFDDLRLSENNLDISNINEYVQKLERSMVK